MSKSVSLHVFRSARRHLMDARHCDALRRASPIPSVNTAATEAFSRAMEALMVELEQLDRLGTLDRIEAFLKRSD